MDMREAFEADYFGNLPATVKGRERSGEGYKYAEPQFAWTIWQSAYKAGMEEGRLAEMRHAAEANHQLLSSLGRLPAPSRDEVMA